ncbi:alpha-L-arabinofuranosidase C-terminus-domain-containing protein [Rhodocollybia butyracea]|uniref:non-reducing end alpha-L-arabinofuranosidase n=1 Tax=Rhodocollybia butyracea TaxID=206335 RepID=A0A9P5P647_9AGAR|nr:alpha-L-arabinofuranosidase C-terminus-domain-containing protein [Rhodocollybia butyracea]
MFEDINHVRSGDGGLYAELIQNRAFQQVTPGTSAALTAWAALGAASITVVKSSSPVSTALPNALSFKPTATSGTVGFTNDGYFGIPVTAGFKYTGSFFYRTPTPPATKISSSFTAELRSTSGTVFTSTTVPFTTSSSWQQATFTFTASSTQTSVENLFALTVNAATIGELTMEFTLISLFPPTFNNRENGMRLDISEVLLAMKPGFFRFPGGNNLEGETAAQRWAWENTVNSLVDRPGRLGTWGYINTEYVRKWPLRIPAMDWDMDMEPIMAVYAEDDLQPYITEAINQINFVIGDASTNAQAAIRSAMGHPEPFALTYIEIGNEDFFSPTTYADYRWADSLTHSQQNSLNFRYQWFCATLTPAPTYWDLHIYSNPSISFSEIRSLEFIFVLGRVCFNDEQCWVDLDFPFIDGSIAEAAYVECFDRNSDIVFAASWAPLLSSVSSIQWTPDLITFSPNTLILSTSYYVQKLFSLFKGDFYLTSTTNTASSPVQWSVTRDTATSQYFLKVVNTATTENTVVFTLPFTPVSTAGTGTILTAPSGTMNTLTNPTAVVPTNFSFTAGKTITYNAPGLSLSILTVLS